jgi:hypothetical protein
MMLPALENIPHSPQDWLYFAWNHRDSHDRIRAAIQAKYNVILNDYQVEPISPDDFNLFLQNNQALHSDMNAVLKLQSSDLQDVNLKDNNQLVSWIKLHWFEHNTAEQALQI